MVYKIKVVKNKDGTDIGYKESFLRFSVDILLLIPIIIGQLIALMYISSTDFPSLRWLDISIETQKNIPQWAEIAGIGQQVWFWSELVVLLFNKKKRAIHDFIAGTVVIHSETQPYNLLDLNKTHNKFHIKSSLSIY